MDDVSVSLHPIATDDENDGKRYCAVFEAGKPRRVIHFEEADSDLELRKKVKQQLEGSGWTLATMTTANPIRLDEVKQRELNEAALDSLHGFLKFVEKTLAAKIELPGNPTEEQRAAFMKLLMQTLPSDLLMQAQKRTGLSESQVRAQLLRFAMLQKARTEE